MLIFLIVVVVLAIIALAVGGAVGIIGGVGKAGSDAVMERARVKTMNPDQWAGEPLAAILSTPVGGEDVRRKVLNGAEARTVEAKLNRGLGKRVNVGVGGFSVGYLSPKNADHAAAIAGVRQQGIKRARVDIGLDSGVPTAVLVLGG